jgi:putative component of toxin-antitoxin plasmid stabilization module
MKIVKCEKIGYGVWELRIECGKSFYGRTHKKVMEQFNKWIEETYK